MKRLISVLVALVMLMLALVPTIALAETKNAWCKMPNAGGSLHLRIWPGKTFESVGYVKDGDALVVYVGETGRDSENEEWTRIKVVRTAKTGYIKTKYISYTAPSASGSGSSSSASATIYVSAGGGSLHVRSGPGTTYASAGYVKHGDSVKVLERGSLWSKIQVVRTGKVGYVKTMYLKSGSTGSSSGSVQVSGGYRVAQVTTRTAGGVVNLRSGAGTGYGSIAKLPRGTKLAVVSTTGNWCRVMTLDGKVGYISKTYVSYGAPGEATAGVNMRTGAGTGYSRICTIPDGARVTVNSVTGNWVNVTYGGRTGYAYISYIALR